MFDLRYHVASLAAVFFALVIGILVGVALASHGLQNTERKRLERSVDDANARADSSNEEVAGLKEDGRANREFVDKAYPAVIGDRLRGTQVAVLFVGPVDVTLLRAVNQTLTDADAPPRLRLRAVTVPLDVAAIDRVLNRRPLLAAYAGPDNLGDLGRELADEFVVGGETPLWNALQNQLVEEQNGTLRRPADAVVIVRTAQPQMGATSRFLTGLFRELGERPIPVVGVETSTTRPSAVPVYRRYSLSSVDDLNRAAGRVALALLLSGAPGGSYGTKRTASDGVLPEVTPVTTTTTAGG